MRTKLAAIASVAILAAVLIGLRVRHRGPAHPKAATPEHADVASDNDLSITAMLNAKEAGTPCETAYAAIDAEQQATKLRGSRSIFQWVAPRADFLAACTALPADVQRCMMPRYRRDHPDECVKLRPDPEALKRLVVPAPDAEATTHGS